MGRGDDTWVWECCGSRDVKAEPLYFGRPVRRGFRGACDEDDEEAFLERMPRFGARFSDAAVVVDLYLDFELELELETELESESESESESPSFQTGESSNSSKTCVACVRN